jgi:hypothetical protein
MQIQFNKRENLIAVGLRVTEAEYRVIKELAARNNVSVAEATHVLLQAALQELKVKTNKK